MKKRIKKGVLLAVVACILGGTLIVGATLGLLNSRITDNGTNPNEDTAEEVICTVKNINLRKLDGSIPGIVNPDEPEGKQSGWSGSKVYYGSYNGSPIRFRVLDAVTYDYNSDGLPTMFLDADTLVGGKQFSSSGAYTWSASEVKVWMNDEENGLLVGFTENERAAIIASYRDNAEGLGEGVKDLAWSDLTGERIFALDAKEATNPAFGYSPFEYASANRTKTLNAKATYWWLRSNSAKNAGSIYPDGNVFYVNPDSNLVGVSAALNVDLTKVLMSSVALHVDKSATVSEVGTDKIHENAWELTLLDESKTVNITEGQKVKRKGNTVTVPYTYTGTDVSQISVMITNKDYTDDGAEVLYYGKLNTNEAEFATGSGVGTFTLPKDVRINYPEYKMYLLAEDVNPQGAVDYASVPMELQYEANVTVDVAYASGDTTNIAVTTTPSDQLYASNDWAARPLIWQGGIYVDGVLNEDCVLIKFLDHYHIDLANLKDANKQTTVKEGTTIVLDGIYGAQDGTDYSVKFNRATFVYGDGRWQQIFEPDVVTDVICDPEGTTPQNGIYIYTNRADKLKYSVDWTVRYAPHSGGVYVEGVYQAGSKLIKLFDFNYYSQYFIDLPGIELKDGLEVVIDGIYGNVQKVQFNRATFRYDEASNKWVQVTNGEIISTGVPGDANADRDVDTCDLVRMLRFEANNEQKINLTDADANKDGYVDSQDRALTRGIIVDSEAFIETYNVSGKPSYNGTTELSIGAYCGPSRGGEGTDYRTAEQFAKYAEAGFNFVISEHDAVYGKNYDANGNEVAYTDFASSDLKKYMELADDAGIGVIVESNVLNSALTSETVDDATKEKLSTMVADLSTMQNFKGLYMGDEPSYLELKNYSNVISYLDSLSGMSGKTKYTSLLPYYCNDNSLTGAVGSTKVAKYSQYLGSFGEKLKLINYDYYPFRQKFSNKYMSSSWFQNLELAATQAYGRADSGITIQAIGIQNSEGVQVCRNVTKKDITYQLYSAMAYGMKNITYYTYWEHFGSNTGNEIFTNSIVSKDGIINQTMYNAVKEANAEIKNFDEIYMDFTWQGTMKISKKDSNGLLEQMSSYNSSRIAVSSASNDTVIGCLKDTKGYDGFMLVNATDPNKNQTSDVTVTFKNAKKALVFVNGIQSEVSLANGTYQVSLAPGQGVFVIPFTD